MRLCKSISLGLAALLVVLQAQLWIGQGSLAELVSLKHQVEAFKKTNAELNSRNRLLEVEVAEFKDGLDSAEEMAREELGMIGSDETFYVVVAH